MTGQNIIPTIHGEREPRGLAKIFHRDQPPSVVNPFEDDLSGIPGNVDLRLMRRRPPVEQIKHIIGPNLPVDPTDPNSPKAS